MDNREWLNQLKVGDPVYFNGRYSTGIAKVKRITNTQIVVERKLATVSTYEEKFKKSDGFSVSGDIWHRSFIQEPTKELRDKLEIQILIAKAKSLIETVAVPETKDELNKFIVSIQCWQKTKTEDEK
jgi:hypothetical protein